MKTLSLIGCLSTLGFSSIQNIQNSQPSSSPSTPSIQFYNGVSDGSYFRLPSTQQIDLLVKDSDILYLQTLIEAVSQDDSLSCDERSGYLQEMGSRIRIQIEKWKKVTKGRLLSVFKEGKQNLDKAEHEQEQVKEESDLQITLINVLKNKLNDLGQYYWDVFSELQTLQHQLMLLQGQNQKYALEIQNLNQNAGTIEQIANLQSQLNVIQSDIQLVILTVQELQAQIQKQQVELEATKSQLMMAQDRANALQQQIQDLQDIINLQKQLIFQIETAVNNSQKRIESLEKYLLTANKAMHLHYYTCFGAIVSNDHIVQKDKFQHYLQQYYGDNVSDVPVYSSDLQLYPINVFDQSWVERYGYPLAGEQVIIPAFNCLAPSKSFAGNARIVDIMSGKIIIESSGHKFDLILGSCSRIQSTSPFPEVGYNISFIGVAATNEKIYVYRAIAWKSQ